MNKIFLTTRMAKGRNMKKRTHRKGTRRMSSRRMRGGYVLTGAELNDTSMNSANKLNLLQGQQYASLHANQHGGVAPVGDTGVMDVGRVEARLGPLDASFQEISGMKDQAGGRRRKSHKSGRKSCRKSRRSGRRSTRKYMRGGVASVNDSTTLLPVSMEKQAVMEMNPEWKLAENPTSFNPTR